MSALYGQRDRIKTCCLNNGEPDDKELASRSHVTHGRAGSGAWIQAESLFCHLGRPEMSGESWAASLHRILASSEVASPMRLMYGPGDALFLNLELAGFLAKEAKRNLIGSFARIVIDEELSDPKGKFPEGHANDSIKLFEALANDEKWLDPLMLHAFLDLDICFDCWIAKLVKNFQPIKDRDYSGGSFDDLFDEASRHGSSLADQFHVHLFTLWFSSEFATKIAMAESTRRAALIRMWITNAPDAEH